MQRKNADGVAAAIACAVRRITVMVDIAQKLLQQFWLIQSHHLIDTKHQYRQLVTSGCHRYTKLLDVLYCACQTEMQRLTARLLTLPCPTGVCLEPLKCLLYIFALSKMVLSSPTNSVQLQFQSIQDLSVSATVFDRMYSSTPCLVNLDYYTVLSRAPMLFHTIDTMKTILPAQQAAKQV